MNRLDDIRNEIDKLDNELIKGLVERFSLVTEVVNYKMENNLEIEDSNREEEILKKIEEKIDDVELIQRINEIYLCLFNQSKLYQKMKVGGN